MCGRGERLALALARENINSLMEGSSQARVEVDVYELQNDSQYTTTDTSESPFIFIRLKERRRAGVRRSTRWSVRCFLQELMERLHLKDPHPES